MTKPSSRCQQNLSGAKHSMQARHLESAFPRRSQGRLPGLWRLLPAHTVLPEVETAGLSAQGQGPRLV